jgi:SLIT-ROBO Rho GTPase activating protein
MMDPYNLAICFGPTVLPVPPDRDQVQFQSHVIEIVRTIIVHQDEIFPQIDPNPNKSTLYEKCQATEAAEEDFGLLT